MTCVESFLQDSQSAYAQSLLLSSPWSHELFDPVAITDLKAKDLHGKTPLQACGWSFTKDKQLRSQQHRIDLSQPSLLRFEDRSSSHSHQRPATSSGFKGPSSSSKKPYYKPSRGRTDDRPFRGGRGNAPRGQFKPATRGNKN